MSSGSSIGVLGLDTSPSSFFFLPGESLEEVRFFFLAFFLFCAEGSVSGLATQGRQEQEGSGAYGSLQVQDGAAQEQDAMRQRHEHGHEHEHGHGHGHGHGHMEQEEQDEGGVLPS